MCAFQDTIDEIGGAPEALLVSNAVAHQSAELDMLAETMNGGYPRCRCQCDDSGCLSEKEGIDQDQQPVDASACRSHGPAPKSVWEMRFTLSERARAGRQNSKRRSLPIATR